MGRNVKERQWCKVGRVSFIVAMSTSKDLNIFLAKSFHKVLVIDDKYASWHVLPGFWNFVFQWSNSEIVLVSLDALGDKLFCRAGEVLSHCPSNFFPNFQQEIQLKNFPVVSLLVLWSFFLYHASIFMFFPLHFSFLSCTILIETSLLCGVFELQHTCAHTLVNLFLQKYLSVWNVCPCSKN